MSAANFDPSLEVVLRFEGGYSDIRSDPGNWTGGKIGAGVLKGTNHGIAASAHPTLDIKGLTKVQAGAIYKAYYWDKVRADGLAIGVDLAVFDAAVNSGPARAEQWLAAALTKSRRDIDLIEAICAKRLSFLHALTSWKAFGKGWGVRVAAVEAAAYRMARAAPETIHVIAAKAAARTAAAKTRARAGAGGAIAAPAAHAATGGSHLVSIILALAGFAAVGVLVFTAWRQAQRSTALTTEAAKVTHA